MDALKIERVILRTLLLSRPGVVVFLAILMVAGMGTAWLEPGGFRNVFVPAIVGITCAAFLSMAGLRLDACCRSAGALGIPMHLQRARRTQLILLFLFVLLPASYLLAMGFGGIALSATFAAGFFGVSLFRNSFPFWVIVAWWLLPKLGVDPWSVVFTPWGTAVIVAGSLAGFALWLHAPMRAHQNGLWDSAGLADARHEEEGAVPTKQGTTDALLAGASSGRLTPGMFWGALGHVSTFNRRATIIEVLVGIAVVVALHAYQHGRVDSAVFLAASILAGAMAGWPFFMMQSAWATSAGEQSLWVLAPRWPAQAALKWLVIRSFWSRIPPALITWLLLAGLGLFAGWIDWQVVARGAMAMFSIAFAFFGFLVLFLAKRRLRKRNRLAMGYLVFTGMAGVSLLPVQGSTMAWGVLCLMLLVPAAFALLAFVLRRPQFPVRPEADMVL